MNPSSLLSFISWKYKVLGLSGVLLLVSVAIAAGGAWFIYEQDRDLRNLVDVAQLRGDRANAVGDSIVDVDRALQRLIAATGRSETRAAAVAAIAATSVLDESVQTLSETLPEKSEVAELAALLETIRPMQLAVIKAARKDDDEAALASSQKLLEETNKAKALSNQLASDERALLTAGLAGISARFKEGVAMVGGLVLIALVLGVALSAYFARLISRPLRTTVGIAERIGAGDFSSTIDVVGNDEIAQLQRAFSSMQSELSARIDEERRIARRNTRIREALDNARANVMLIGSDGAVSYLNGMMRRTFTELDGIDVDTVIGQDPVAIVADTPAATAIERTLALESPQELTFQDRIFELFANQVIGEGGEVLGTVIEWKERTYERAVEREIEQIVVAARAGDLTQRVSTDDKDGFFALLATGINELLDVASDSLNDIAQVMHSLSDGDLTQAITREYAGIFGSVKSDVNATLDDLGRIVQQIRHTSATMSTSCSSIASGSQDVATRTRKQAESLANTADAMREMTGLVRRSAADARDADALAAQAQTEADSGGQVVHRAVSAMDEISTASEQISDIIHVIDEIAFQTNLLALNAAVEAARAGEHGQGFAVVASEVRNLAQRSARAAKEIKDLIGDTVAKVTDGSQQVAKSGEALERIVETTGRVSAIINTIAEASERQASAIEGLSADVDAMDTSARDCADLVAEAAGSSEATSATALELRNLVEYFTVRGDGAAVDQKDAA